MPRHQSSSAGLGQCCLSAPDTGHLGFVVRISLPPLWEAEGCWLHGQRMWCQVLRTRPKLFLTSPLVCGVDLASPRAVWLPLGPRESLAAHLSCDGVMGLWSGFGQRRLCVILFLFVHLSEIFRHSRCWFSASQWGGKACEQGGSVAKTGLASV